MPIGIIINSVSLLAGGLIGAIFKEKIPVRLRTSLPMVFGLISVGLGVSLITRMGTLSAVVLALIIGFIVGELWDLEEKIQFLGLQLQKLIGKFIKNSNELDAPGAKEKLVAFIVLSCTSTTGSIGALTEGMTGDYSILITKSCLDFFTAIIFAVALGYVISLISIPQFGLMLMLYFLASYIMPLTTPTMINDFSACGGMILIATGLRICEIKNFPVTNMLPALVLVMPISYLWNMLGI